jgi:hypothetical protein
MRGSRTPRARPPHPLIKGGGAYSSSKLCNVLTPRGLAAQPDTTVRHSSVIAYDPGHTPGTRLMRNGNFITNFLWKHWRRLCASYRVARTLPKPRTRLSPKLALGQIRSPSGRIYGALRSGIITWPDPSEMARPDDAREALWLDSSALVGLAVTGKYSRPQARRMSSRCSPICRKSDTPSTTEANLGAPGARVRLGQDPFEVGSVSPRYQLLEQSEHTPLLHWEEWF